jgi:hypothetical protein
LCSLPATKAMPRDGDCALWRCSAGLIMTAAPRWRHDGAKRKRSGHGSGHGREPARP